MGDFKTNFLTKKSPLKYYLINIHLFLKEMQLEVKKLEFKQSNHRNRMISNQAKGKENSRIILPQTKKYVMVQKIKHISSIIQLKRRELETADESTIRNALENLIRADFNKENLTKRAQSRLLSTEFLSQCHY